jgi:hypothetical protein
MPAINKVILRLIKHYTMKEYEEWVVNTRFLELDTSWKLSGQLHAPAVLSSWKDFSVPIK